MQGVLGGTFTFQVMWRNAVNAPQAMDNPTIDIFTMDNGAKTMLVAGGVMVAPVPAEVGRYVYPYAISNALADGTVIYAEMSALEIGTGNLFIKEVAINAVAILTTSYGLVASQISGP